MSLKKQIEMLKKDMFGQIPPDVQQLQALQQVLPDIHGLGTQLMAVSPELPMPATYVIGRNSVILDGFVSTAYTQRMEPAKILAILRTNQQ